MTTSAGRTIDLPANAALGTYYNLVNACPAGYTTIGCNCSINEWPVEYLLMKVWSPAIPNPIPGQDECACGYINAFGDPTDNVGSISIQAICIQ